MKLPTVSIVICNYNYGRFLDEAISSAVAQTYRHVEVIVVDDGSTDNSREVIARYQDHLCCIFKANGGQGSAMNAGYAASRGDLVIFLDADDRLRPETAARVAASWRPAVAKVQYLLELVDVGNQPLGSVMPPVPCEPSDAQRLLCAYGYYPSPPCSGNAYARWFLDRILPLDAAIWPTHADAPLFDLAPLSGEVIHLDEVLGSYRLHGENVSDLGQHDLAKLRRFIAFDQQRERTIHRWARLAQLPINADLFLRNPQHCKRRLTSLRLDAAGHPYPTDTVCRLVMAGIAAAIRFPHLPAGKRMLIAAGFLALGVLPRTVIAANLDAVMNVHARRLAWLLKGREPISSTRTAADRR